MAKYRDPKTRRCAGMDRRGCVITVCPWNHMHLNIWRKGRSNTFRSTRTSAKSTLLRTNPSSSPLTCRHLANHITESDEIALQGIHPGLRAYVRSVSLVRLPYSHSRSEWWTTSNSHPQPQSTPYSTSGESLAHNGWVSFTADTKSTPRCL